MVMGGLSRKALATIKSQDPRVILLLPAPRPRIGRKEIAIVITKVKLRLNCILMVIMMVSSENKGKQVVIVIVTEDDAVRNHSATADWATSIGNPWCYREMRTFI
jgi:hypothetical protein